MRFCYFQEIIFLNQFCKRFCQLCKIFPSNVFLTTIPTSRGPISITQSNPFTCFMTCDFFSSWHSVISNPFKHSLLVHIRCSHPDILFISRSLHNNVGLDILQLIHRVKGQQSCCLILYLLKLKNQIGTVLRNNVRLLHYIMK